MWCGSPADTGRGEREWFEAEEVPRAASLTPCSGDTIADPDEHIHTLLPQVKSSTNYSGIHAKIDANIEK